ncbi:MAG: DNA repair protein RecO [Planctomycetes bacterium]|nr:DNA repair protein RecO [Planctomycetota bacterium]
MLIKDTAICIRAVDYSETSQIVTFFARAAGKISAIAKGSKRPKSAFDGPIEIFSYGKIVFSDSNKEKLATLTEFESACGGAGFTGLSNNLFTLNCCLFSTELLNKFTHDYDPHPQLFDDFLQFLQNAQENKNKHQMLALLILFQLGLLKEVGLQPILNYCVNCKTRYEHRVSNIEHRVYFSSSANGLICRDCEASFPDKVRLTERAANCLSNLKLLAESQEKTLNEIEKVLVHHFTELLGHKPKMAKYVLTSSP